jgi:hypothetical protein
MDSRKRTQRTQRWKSRRWQGNDCQRNGNDGFFPFYSPDNHSSAKSSRLGLCAPCVLLRLFSYLESPDLETANSVQRNLKNVKSVFCLFSVWNLLSLNSFQLKRGHFHFVPDLGKFVQICAKKNKKSTPMKIKIRIRNCAASARFDFPYSLP